MEKIKQVLHPKESTHKTDATTNNPSSTTTATHPQSSSLPSDTRTDQETLDRLGSEPNVTGSNRPPPHEEFPSHSTTTTTTGHGGDQPKINRGHHHPRQPVGETGPPAGHHAGAAPAGQGPEAGGAAHAIKAQAEASNNFPGTNPDPSHSA
ncbi:hypothetical protein Daus18300_000197 [Diaporthe australafricana]|uniref:Uncharacterized protein n=1 Tax=Diaporthe australafricana TaxID=127596 RepID=A0ABR3Y715_9PEZI